MLILKVEYAVEQTDDVWMTSQLEMPALERRWPEGMARTGFAYADAMSVTWIAEVTGAVLKHRNVVRLTDLQAGKVSVKTEVMEAVDLETLPSSVIPEDTFSMPECRQVDKAEMEKRAKRFIKNTLR